MFTPIRDIFEKLELLAGNQISVSGRLLVGEEDRSFLATDYEAYKRGQRVPLIDSNRIATHLLRTLPAYGGGDVIYDEKVNLTGTVLKRPGGYELSDLRTCSVVRDDIEIPIPLDARPDATAK